MRNLRRKRPGEEMKIPDGVGRGQIQALIDEWIIGKNAERDRAILSRRLLDGICIEPLAEEFELSVAQVKRIIAKGTDKIFRHL